MKEKFNLKIYVAHINHGLRENAKIDEQYVKQFCEKNNLECFIKNILIFTPRFCYSLLTYI